MWASAGGKEGSGAGRQAGRQFRAQDRGEAQHQQLWLSAGRQPAPPALPRPAPPALPRRLPPASPCAVAMSCTPLWAMVRAARHSASVPISSMTITSAGSSRVRARARSTRSLGRGRAGRGELEQRGGAGKRQLLQHRSDNQHIISSTLLACDSQQPRSSPGAAAREAAPAGQARPGQGRQRGIRGGRSEQAGRQALGAGSVRAGAQAAAPHLHPAPRQQRSAGEPSQAGRHTCMRRARPIPGCGMSPSPPISFEVSTITTRRWQSSASMRLISRMAVVLPTPGRPAGRQRGGAKDGGWRLG